MKAKNDTPKRTLSERINADPFVRLFSMVLAMLSWLAVFATISLQFGGLISVYVFFVMILCVALASAINTFHGWRYD